MRNYTYWQLSTRKASIFVSTDSEAMPQNNYCLHDVLDGIYFVEYKINHLYEKALHIIYNCFRCL